MILTGIILIIIALYIFTETTYKIGAVILIGVALQFITNYYKLQSIRDSTQMTNWTQVNSLKLYDKIIEKHGLPILNINKSGGLAIWNKNSKNQLIYDEIILRDEDIKNANIKMNIYSVYLYIKIYIPPNKLNEILNLDVRLSYNKPKFTLCIFSNSIENNELILNILKIIHPEYKKLTDISKFIKVNKNTYKHQLESYTYSK